MTPEQLKVLSDQAKELGNYERVYCAHPNQGPTIDGRCYNWMCYTCGAMWVKDKEPVPHVHLGYIVPPDPNEKGR